MDLIPHDNRIEARRFYNSRLMSVTINNKGIDLFYGILEKSVFSMIGAIFDFVYAVKSIQEF